jgi:DNA-binding NarL/FixJ family response regulator
MQQNAVFYVADLIKLQILYTSPQVLDITGVEPEKFDLSYDYTFTHPVDIQRRSRARANIIETSQEIFINKSDAVVISSNFRIRKIGGEYVNVVTQCYLFYQEAPADTVYILQISTPIDDWLTNIIKRGNYHWYSGNVLTYFRYPDEELMFTGSNLSYREMEIIRYIHKGMETKEIGEKLFLSPYTISTHRRNILKKSGKASIGKVIFELEGFGIILYIGIRCLLFKWLSEVRLSGFFK